MEMAVFKALMDYYDDSFNILSIVLYGIVLGIFWTLFRRFELSKHLKAESFNEETNLQPTFTDMWKRRTWKTQSIGCYGILFINN